jgi:hypothetical protein
MLLMQVSAETRNENSRKGGQNSYRNSAPSHVATLGERTDRAEQHRAMQGEGGSESAGRRIAALRHQLDKVVAFERASDYVRNSHH